MQQPPQYGPEYGQQPQPNYGQPGFQPQQTNGLSVASLVSGILGVTIFFGVGSIVALICGYMARSQIKRSMGTQGGSGMAIIGIVLGWIGLVFTALMVALIVAGTIAIFNFAQSDEFREFIDEGKAVILEEQLDQVSEVEAECAPVETYSEMAPRHIEDGAPHKPYNSNPPTSGPHYAVPASPGFYETSEAPDPEQVVHNLEHGQVVIWYRPNINTFFESQIAQLVAQAPQHTVAVPFEEMNTPYNIVITTWTKARACENASQDVVDDFREKFQGRAPEPLTPRFKG